MSLITFFKRFRELSLADYFSIIIFPIAFIFSLFFREKNKDLILICESENEARDNGYWLFKYICENHPEQQVAYVINFKSIDYEKVRVLGKCIEYGSFKHWVYYLSANINASSQKGGKPNAALFYLLEVFGFLKNKRVFLQHGITINDGKWLYYENTKFRSFICGAKPEYDAIKNFFGYPSSNVHYLGFTRFDQLHNLTVNRNQILLMPSWREWLVTKTDAYYNFNESSDFTLSEYYLKWNEFLNSEELISFLEKNGLILLFYPHRNLQKFLSYFNKRSDNIIFANWQEYDIQELLKSSAYLITDYSSVFMDFAYMRKAMLFYQFDYEKFRLGQYEKGYFDYKDDGFGQVLYDVDSVIGELKKAFQTDFKLQDIYLDRVDKFFPLYDKNNSFRTYQHLLDLLYEK